MTTSSHLDFHIPVVPEPRRDWDRLCVVLVLILAVLISVSGSVFRKVSKGEVVGSAEAVTAPAFSPASVESIHSLFNGRATEEKKYRTGTYRFDDPSQ